jgi:hypothetical protein
MPVRLLGNPFDAERLLENALDRGVDAGSLLFGPLFQEDPDRFLGAMDSDCFHEKDPRIET